MTAMPKQPDTGETGAIPTPTSFEVARRLFTENVAGHWFSYAKAIALMLIASGCTALVAWIMEDVVNQIFVNRRRDLIPLISAAVAAIFIVRALASYLQSITLARAGNNIVARLQSRGYESILAQSLHYFQRRSPGDLVARMSGNVQMARQAIEIILLRAGRDATTLVALYGVMIVKDAILSLIALVSAPAISYVLYSVNRRLRRHAEAEFDSRSELISAVQETSSGADVIKAFTHEPQMRARAEAGIADIEIQRNKIERLTARVSPILEIMGGLSVAGVILYGGYVVGGDEEGPGWLFAFLTALLLAYQPARRIVRSRAQLETLLVSVRLLFALIDSPPEISDHPDAKPLRVSTGGIRLRNITFTYPQSAEPALRDLDLEARPGELTALVGPTGAGKSTVFSLIERFIVPDAGQVEIDGQDLRATTERSIREKVALVTQDPSLLHGTIRSNIRLGKPGATDAEIEAAARDAEAHSMIAALPDGYETRVGARGTMLSGGQRQLIAVARALLRRAPILLLDEPTASLDAETEARLQEALARLMKGRTSIVIAHRLSTIRNADIVHVINRGRVAQSGTHEQLLAKGGLYARLLELQTASVIRDRAGTAESPPET